MPIYLDNSSTTFPKPPAVVEAIYGRGRVVDEHFDGCSYLVEQADAKAMAEAARKVETVGGSVKLVLKKLPEDA